MKPLHNIFVLFALFFASLAIGQNNSIKFINLSIKEGLSQSSVNHVLQDKRGFMWFGTQDGLNRHDGYNYTVLKHNPSDSFSISDNYINVIFEDKKGILWIGTEGGLNKFDPQTEKFTAYKFDITTKNSISNNSVLTIAEAQGYLWIGTESGLNKFDSEKENFTRYFHNNTDSSSISNNRIKVLYTDKSGTLWIGTDYGLSVLEKKQSKFHSFFSSTINPNTLSNNAVLSIIEDKEGFIWIGTNDGLNRFNKNSKKFNRFYSKENDSKSLSHNVINTLFEDGSGSLWIGTSGGGLNRYKKENEQFSRFQYHSNIPSSLANNIVYSIYEDRTGTLWIGTNGGISKFDHNKQNFHHYRNIPGSSNSINSNVVWSLFEDENGVLWIGTDKGLNRFNRTNNSVKYFSHKSSNQARYFNESIYSIYKDKSGLLWIGTDAGLFTFNSSTETFNFFKPKNKRDLGLGTVRIYTIFEDKEQNLWVGSKDGLYFIDKSKEQVKLYRSDLLKEGTISNNVIRSVLQDKAGNIWVGTNGGGLNKIIQHSSDSISFDHYKSNDKSQGTLNNNIILSLYEDNEGIIWIGTYGGGLNKFDPSSELFTSYTEENGLSNNAIYGVLSDKNQNLWMSSNKGVSRFNPKIEKFQNYFENDGLQSNEFNIGAFYGGNSGELFFGGINGFNAFSPENIHINEIPPQVVLTDLLIFNKRVIIGEKNSPLSKAFQETEEIELNHKQSVITFEFAALHYSSPDKNNCAFIMEGFDEEWNYVGQRRQATYTNLDPGTYVFRVKGANSDGIWNEQGASVIVTILPPFWKTWWFRLLITVFILGCFFAIYKSRIKIIEAQNRHLERLVQERTTKILKQTQKIEAQKELLEKEKDKVEKLLLNMLPQEMVEELKNKGKASARHYRMSSIMFTDFKGFTQIAESLRPKDLIAELDRCFVKFDEVIEKYGLEKIKTIGDSYMCAGGLPIRNKSNPVDIVLAGLEIQRFMDELQKEKISMGQKYWELRIGINTGEVIAGVVGIKRFAYDIWGDSVNIASRMEMHGEVGKVNISGKTYDHIKDYFDCTYRGKVLAKNKGEVDMYYVDRIKPELSENNEGIIPNETFKSNLATVLFYKINYKKAEQFIMKKLEEELPDDLFYHAINHTIDVRDSAEKIGIIEGVDGEDMMVLKTAAMYHDAGFTKQYFKNEPFGVAMSKEILPNFGYSPEQIDTIEKMIMATQVPQTAKTLLEKILCDADLDYLGRDDFYTIGNNLKKELMARDIVKDDKQWDELQISFLQKHKYFTDSSKNTREPEKLKRLEEIKKRLLENNYQQNKTNQVS
ncbi:MAG: hypothetical protein M3Q58_14560 [Bacteroidota bacterium]|nr:hypothetical protein [Bacteroidota bacterium]